jgi:hypothetical protein
MDKIHNLYITSENNKLGNTNYNYNLYFSSYGINIAPDEDAYLNITSFQTLNTFYNINDKSNKFMIKYVYGSGNGSGGGGGGGGGNGNGGGGGTMVQPFIIENGNYNIYEFEEIINYLCEPFFAIKYDSKKNKWNYIRNVNVSVGDSIYIIPNEYNYKYFGLSADVETEIIVDSVLSNQINLNNFGLIVIKVMGLIETNRTLDNLNKNISSGDIYALISRQDNIVNSLINWQDFNGTFKKKIANNEINYLNFIFTDEYNNLLIDMNDWLLTMTITIQKKIQYQPLQQ